MKKVIFLLTMVMSVSLFSQTETVSSNDNDDFYRWQVRLRGVGVFPNENDNLGSPNVKIKEAYIPELDFTYFFTKNIAAELILGTSKHDVKVKNFVPGTDVDLGHVWLLPPTLNFQYHFYSYSGKIKPYLGAGINYTFFYGIDSGDVEDIEYDSALGFSFQTGFDYFIGDRWFINADLKYLILGTDVTVNVDGTTKIPVDVNINPILGGVGLGYRF